MLRFVLFIASAVAFAADPLSITVERVRDDNWSAVNPALVLDGGDEIRFRVRSSESAYLYILNESLTGERRWLFPAAGAPTHNRLETGRDYVIPDPDASYTVARQPGFESVYFILTTVRLPSLPAATPPGESRAPENTLMPRCNESSLRARGLCMDDQAGTRAVHDNRRIEQLVGRQAGRIWIQELRLAHR